MADYTLTAKMTADAKGLQKGFQSAQTALANMQKNTSNFGKNLQDIGKSVGKVGDTLTRRITVPAVAATTALTGITLVKGFQRLTGIDTAQAKLKGLGHDAESVEEIMNSALDSVSGTSYGLDEAATTAANAVAAGIPPGKELTRYLSLTGDAAAIAGSSLGDMGSIINKVQTAQKAYNGDLNMLSDRGIPIYQWLADEANTTAENVRDMAADGEISSEMFLNAIEKNIGGAAKVMGEESFMAGLANIGAAVGRLGANFLDAGGEAGGFFSTIKPLIPEAIGFIDGLADKAQEMGVRFGEALNNFIGRISDLIGWFNDLSPTMQRVITIGAGIGAALLVGIGPALKMIGGVISAVGVLTTVFSFLISPIGIVIGVIAALATVFVLAWRQSEEFRNIVMNAFETISGIISTVVATVAPILQNMFLSGREAVSEFASTIGDRLVSAFELIGSVVGTVVEVIGGFVSSIVEGFQSAGGELSNLSALFIGFNPVLKIAMLVLSEFGPQIAEGLSQIASLVLPLLTTLGEMLGQLAAAVIPLVMNVISTLIPIIIQLATSIMSIIAEVLPVLLELFMQLVPVVMSLVETVIGLVSQMLPLVSVVIDALVPVLMLLVQNILNIVTAVAPALIGIIQAVISIFQAVIPVVMAVLTAVIQVMANIISAITPIIAFVAGVISNIISVISPIVTFIAGIITSIFSVIQPITTFVSGVFSTVFSIISGIFRSVTSTISGAISSISGIISKLSGTVSGVFNSISSTVSSVMGTVSSIISGVFSAIQGAWTGLTSMVSNIFSGISSSVETLVGQVKSFINGVIGGINAAIGLINKIPGVSISTIPQLQHGTDDWAGGFARMNEGGRGELVMLPGGTQVIPHDVSMKYAREAGRQSGMSQGVMEERGSGINLSRVEQLLENLYAKEQALIIDGQKFAEVTYEHYDQAGGNTTDLTERWGR